MKHTFNTLKSNTTKEGKYRRRVLAASLGVLKKHKMMRDASREIGVRWNFLVNCSKLGDGDEDEKSWGHREQRKDSLSQETRRKVEEFYTRPDIGTDLPFKKRVSKKKLEAAKVLDRSIDRVYEEFQEQNPEINVSRSKFASLRPGHVKTMAKNKFNQCLCEYCTNIELKLHPLNKFLEIKRRSDYKITDHYAASRNSL